MPGSEAERDLEQVRLAIDGARALLPVVEPALGPNSGPLRDALSQLQMAYAQLAGAAGGGEPGEGRRPRAPASRASPGPGRREAPGPAQSSGRLWVPGQ